MNLTMNCRIGHLPGYCAATFLWPLILLASCTTIDYQGDGKFVDRGPFEGTDRYVVDLGVVDLGKAGQYKYVVGNLPPVQFFAGLEILENKPNVPRQRPPHGGRIRLLLETENGQRVFGVDAPLDEWGWSFRNNEPRSFLHQGSGSSFLPRSGAKYRLALEVVEPQPQARPARLLVKGGGWQ